MTVHIRPNRNMDVYVFQQRLCKLIVAHIFSTSAGIEVANRYLVLEKSLHPFIYKLHAAFKFKVLTKFNETLVLYQKDVFLCQWQRTKLPLYKASRLLVGEYHQFLDKFYDVHGMVDNPGDHFYPFQHLDGILVMKTLDEHHWRTIF